MEDFVKVDEMKSHGHMSATITDAILQTGMDYENVVQPRLNELKKQLAEIEADMEQYFAPYQREIDLLDTILGVGPQVAQVILAEIGPDMSVKLN